MSQQVFAQINPENIKIARDKWGVPHIFAKTDAEVSYGLAWANAEDDFKTMQLTMLAGKGMVGKLKGKDGASIDYVVALLHCREVVEEQYDKTLSPEYKALIEGYVAGINAYAAKHPEEVLLKGSFPTNTKEYMTSIVLSLSVISGVDGVLQKIFSGKIKTLDSDVKELKMKNDSLSKELNKYLINSYKSTEVIDKVNNYYDNAWSKLIYLLSIIGSLTLIILPLLLTYQQKRELRLNKKDFEEYTDKKISKLEKRIIAFNAKEIEKVRLEIEDLNKNIVNKQDKDINKIYAMTYYLQGINAETNKNADLMLKSFITSVRHIIQAKEDGNLSLTLDMIIKTLDMKIKNKTKLTESDLSNVEKINSEINESFPEKYNEKLVIINSKVETLSA